MRPQLATFLLLFAALAFVATRAHAVSVTIVPADTSVSVGDTLTLRVVATAFPDLKGYQLIQTYDPLHLASVEVRAGDVLTGAPGAWTAYVIPPASSPADSTWLDAAMLDGSTSTPGVLEYLVFRATATGLAHVDCEHTEFRDSQNAWTYPDCTGAVIHVGGPTATRRPSWGQLKAAYR